MFHYLGKVNRGPKPGGGEVNFASGGLSPLGVGDSSDMLGPKPGGGEVNFPTDPDIFALSEI